jgi:hypothetical protein
MALPMEGDAGRGNDRVYRRIEEWKHRLVDLSRRNRLLFFGRGRGATLQVLEPSADEVFARLTVRGRAWRFWVPAETGEVRVATSVGQLPTGYNENKELARRQRHFPEIAIALSRKADELACNISDAAELVRLLKNVHKRSRTDFEERGVRILHLAFGMLSWQERDGMETVRSPLVLVPVELVRESAKHPFELRPVRRSARPTANRVERRSDLRRRCSLRGPALHNRSIRYPHSTRSL